MSEDVQKWMLEKWDVFNTGATCVTVILAF